MSESETNYPVQKARELVSRHISQYFADAIKDCPAEEKESRQKCRLFRTLYSHYFDGYDSVSEQKLQQAFEVIRQDLEDGRNVVLTRKDNVFDSIRLSLELNLPTCIYKVRAIRKSHNGDFRAVLATRLECPTFYNYRICYNVCNPHPYEVWCDELNYSPVMFGSADSYEEARKLTVILYERYKDAKVRAEVLQPVKPKTEQGAYIPLVYPFFMYYEYTGDGRVYSVHVDGEYADDIHYDIMAEEWRKFCQIYLGYGDEVENFNKFLTEHKAGYEFNKFVFEKALEKARIRFDRISFYSYDYD